jgi:hypothetical protein
MISERCLKGKLKATMGRDASFALKAIAICALAVAAAEAQVDSGVPHLRKQGTATQLVVDGKPYLALAGELGNDTATSLENMEPVWPRLVSGNLNTVLMAVSWAQLEPEEGKFDFALVDGLIRKARENHLHIVFLWFGSWKNGFSSYAPLWVKRDYVRFPRIQLTNGRTVELLSTFGDATRDADAAAFGALMRHIKEVDEHDHTVLMMQVENEVGVLRDTRDRSAAANRAYSGQVPPELMKYLAAHSQSLNTELRDIWAANGNKSSGTWEEVLGPGKPSSIEVPMQTKSPPLSAEQNDWRRLYWPSDEIFMAWNYARYVEKVVEAGKRGYDIPMYANAWLQQPNMAWPGTYPSGGPLPEVHDIWRAGAPSLDVLAPDLYLKYFDEVCERFTHNGNPLFIPETTFNPANAVVAAGKYNAIGFSPFFIELRIGPDTDLASTYKILSELSPMILAHQGSDTMTAVWMNEDDEPVQVKLGNYTLELTYSGRGRGPVAPQPKAPAAQPGAKPAPPPPELGGNQNQGPLEAAAVLIATGPDEYYFGGGGMRIAFTPNTPGPPTVGLGDVQQGEFVDGKWKVIRQLAGDDTAQGEILTLRPNTILRVTLYRYP